MKIRDFVEVAAPFSPIVLFDGERVVGHYDDARDIAPEYWDAEVYRIEQVTEVNGRETFPCIGVTIYRGF